MCGKIVFHEIGPWLGTTVLKYMWGCVQVICKYYAILYKGLEHSQILVSISSVAQSCLTLWPYGLQHTRLPCPSPTPGACSNSCPSSQWCHPTISSSVVPFSSRLQSSPASGPFPMNLWKSWNQFPTNTEGMTINPPSFFELRMLACVGVQALIFLYLHQPLSWFHVDSSLITTFLHIAA